MEKGERVLVVDDDPDLLYATARLLRSAGYEVDEASTGEGCLQALRNEKPSLVLLDVILPDINGFEVCHAIKADPQTADVLVILISGLETSSDTRADALTMGADGYIPRPVQNRELLARVKSLLRLKHAEDALRQAHDELEHRVRARTAELAKSNEALRAEIAERKKVEEDLKDRLHFEHLLSELSARFINLSPGEFDRVITEWLRRLVEYLEADRSTIGTLTENNSVLRLSHSYAVPGVPEFPPMIVNEKLPWYSSMVAHGEVLIFERLPEDLPPEAEAERKYCETEGLKSNLSIPLRVGERTLGVLAFGVFRGHRHWPEGLVQRLRLVADVLANAILRERTEEELRTKTRGLAEAQRIAHLGNWEWNIVTNELTWSDEVFRIFGLEPDEFGATYEAFLNSVHPGDRRSVEEAVNHALSDPDFRYAIDHRVMRPDGSERFVHEEGEVTFDDSGAPIRMIGTVLDITEMKAAQEEIRRSEERFRAIADYTHDWEIWTAPDGSLIWTNPAVERVTGYTREEYENLSERIATVVVEEDLPKVRALLSNAGKRGASASDLPLRIRRKDGSILWVSVSYQPIYGAGERYLGVRTSIRDVTERRQTEMEAQQLREQLARMTRVTTMGELAASLAHQLNQPLAAILSNAQAARRFLANERPDLDEVRDALADIIDDDRRAGEVIRRLRDLFRKGELEKVSLDLNELIREIASLLQSQALLKSIGIKLDLDDTIPRILGDRVQLQQVIMNMMVNGIDAMVDVEADRRKLVVRTSMPDPDSVQVSIRDRGTGISEDSMVHVFDPFFTTKPGGMGMGLSVCRSIVEAHRGRLWVANNPDYGTTFHFSLPTMKENSA